MVPQEAFIAQVPPPMPDYSQDDAWAALPGIEDCSDVNPPGLVEPLENSDDYTYKKDVDVFYLHPSTSYSSTRWNAAHNDPFVRFMTDDAILTQQGSAFNGAGEVDGSEPNPNPNLNPKCSLNPNPNRNPNWRSMHQDGDKCRPGATLRQWKTGKEP